MGADAVQGHVAQHAPVFGREIFAPMHGTAVVPHEQIARRPFVDIDELGSLQMVEQLVEQIVACGLLQSDLQRKVSMFTWLPELWQRSKQQPLN
jgi:hypothetical protein